FFFKFLTVFSQFTHSFPLLFYKLVFTYIDSLVYSEGGTSSLQSYLQRYKLLEGIDIDNINLQFEQPLIDYLYKLAIRYNARDLKRFNEHKRYSVMVCFLVEIRKILLDYLVKMHDQFVQEMLRESKHIHEKKYREFRKRQKSAIDTRLSVTNMIFTWPDDQPLQKKQIIQCAGENKLLNSVNDLHAFKQLEECGLGDILLNRYPSLRKYFAGFIILPFVVKHGSEPLLNAINIIRQLDNGIIKSLPSNLPTSFIPKELHGCYKNKDGKIQRNAWELGLAIAIKDALHSGDLYLPKSKQYVSFWELIMNEHNWHESKENAYQELQQSHPENVKTVLVTGFNQALANAKKKFTTDNFAEIKNGKLNLKRDDKAEIPDKVKQLQKVIDSRMPIIRIEQLLVEVDQQTNFTRHFIPIQQHNARPRNFYKTLIAALISQATNLGIVAMSSSVDGVSVDMLRHIFQFYVSEETIQAASAEIVNQHHQLPFAEIHGAGKLSSSDAQRFKMRADSLLSAYYPRYYGYYEKAIGIYTHISDQYSVFSTKVISCSPREALYVLDGLLENNTILKIQEHTTDTHGYTEIIFALCYLLGYRFMPRIRDLKDQQLYRIEKNVDYGIFTPLLNKTADINIVEEQWEHMIRVAQSLKQKTAPAHVIVQRLTNIFPLDRLSRAFTNLGRII
ncbi:Transposase, TnpA family, partial [Candidatus Jidaibacter acanthamoeba]